MTRYFLALIPPREVQEAHAKILDQLSDYAQKHGWDLAQEKPTHITVNFLGELEDNEIQKLKSGVVKLLEEEHTPFKLITGELNYFWMPEEHKVVYWSVIDPKNKLRELYQRIKNIDEGIRGQRNDFDFKPHMTLAIHEYEEDLEKFPERLVEIPGSYEFTVDSIFLVESRKKCGGNNSKYVRTEEFELK